MECLSSARIVKSWYSKQIDCPHASWQKIEISSSSSSSLVSSSSIVSSSSSASESWILAITLCRHKFEYMIDFVPYLDIVPLILSSSSSFQEANVNPFNGLSGIMGILAPDAKPVLSKELTTEKKFEICDRVASAILNALVSSQVQTLKALKLLSAPLEFEIEMLEGIPNRTIFVGYREKTRQYIVSIDFPVLPYLQSTNDAEVKEMVDYIARIQSDAELKCSHNQSCRNLSKGFHSMRLCRHLLISVDRKEIIKIEDKLSIPSKYYATSSSVNLGSYSQPSRKPFTSSVAIDITGEDNISKSCGNASNVAGAGTDVDPESTGTLYDVSVKLVKIIAAKWIPRQAFVRELSCISAVLEFDAVDYSFVVIAMRLRQGQQCTVCTVEYRLPASFPETTMPLISVHDLQTGNSSLLDSAILWQKAQLVKPSSGSRWNMALVAELCFTLARDYIHQQAFADTS